MGYYCQIHDSDCKIPVAQRTVAYQRFCTLNERTDLMSGGVWGKNASGEPEKKEHWFSWMPPDFPTELRTAHDVLECLGFEVDENAEGDLVIMYYDSKIGQAEYFFQVIDDLVVPSKEGDPDNGFPFVSWAGEDGSTWRWLFTDKGMVVQDGLTRIEWIGD